MKNSEIKIGVTLDENKVPQEIKWATTGDDNHQDPKECKAFLLSLFDKDHKETFKIDLWTKDMQVIEMDRFFYQTLRGLADTYFNATQNKPLAEDMQRFVQYFGQQVEIIAKE